MVAPKLFIDLAPKPGFELLERERRQIVNNFAPSAPPDYELSSCSADESDETFEPGGQA
jgi:hypothetical protein